MQDPTLADIGSCNAVRCEVERTRKTRRLDVEQRVFLNNPAAMDQAGPEQENFEKKSPQYDQPLILSSALSAPVTELLYCTRA